MSNATPKAKRMDLAFAALLIAALSAKGRSVIHNVHQIDRGYQNIDGRLNAIGAKITRV